MMIFGPFVSDDLFEKKYLYSVYKLFPLSYSQSTSVCFYRYLTIRVCKYAFKMWMCVKFLKCIQLWRYIVFILLLKLEWTLFKFRMRFLLKRMASHLTIICLEKSSIWLFMIWHDSATWHCGGNWFAWLLIMNVCMVVSDDDNGGGGYVTY